MSAYRPFILFILFIGSLAATGLAAEPRPFEKLHAMTASDIAFAGPKAHIVAEFNAERVRLDKQFEESLLRFVGENPTRHYWCGCFLTTDSYLGNNAPNRLLAVVLWEQGVLLEAAKQPEPNAQLRALHELLAIQYSRMRLHTLASFHKQQAECLWKAFEVGGPATSPEDTEVYDAIPLPGAVKGNLKPHLLVDPATGQLWIEKNGKCKPAKERRDE